VRDDRPNEDAIGWSPDSGSGPPLSLTVSDGHGDQMCFRAHTGARLAVSAAGAAWGGLLANQPASHELSAIKRWSEEDLPREIVQLWRNEVADHGSAVPLSIEELSQLEMARGEQQRRRVALEPALAYGATVLSVMVQESFITYVQLGDGDMLTVSDTGQVTRPIPEDERLLGNETFSLCLPDASRYFRVVFQAVSTTPPALILVSSDGYANSFRDEEGFLRVGADIWELIATDGLGGLQANLEYQLTRASYLGSGDDITLGIMCRLDAFNRAGDTLTSCDHRGDHVQGTTQVPQPPGGSTPSSGPTDTPPATEADPSYANSQESNFLDPMFFPRNGTPESGQGGGNRRVAHAYTRGAESRAKRVAQWLHNRSDSGARTCLRAVTTGPAGGCGAHTAYTKGDRGGESTSGTWRHGPNGVLGIGMHGAGVPGGRRPG